MRGGKRSRQIDMSEYLARGLRRKPDERVQTYSGVVERYLKNAGERRREEDWWSPRVFTGAMAWLDEHVRHEPTQPFSLFVESYDPHEPWDPPKKYVDLYDDPDYRGVEPISPLYGRDDYLTRAREAADARAVRRRADDGRQAGSATLMEHLDRLRLLERTVVVFWSDHGALARRTAASSASRRSQMYAEMVDVPLLIRHPEGRKAGDDDELPRPAARPHADRRWRCSGSPAPRAIEGHDLSPLFRDADLQAARGPDRRLQRLRLGGRRALLVHRLEPVQEPEALRPPRRPARAARRLGSRRTTS